MEAVGGIVFLNRIECIFNVTNRACPVVQIERG